MKTMVDMVLNAIQVGRYFRFLLRLYIAMMLCLLDYLVLHQFGSMVFLDLTVPSRS